MNEYWILPTIFPQILGALHCLSFLVNVLDLTCKHFRIPRFCRMVASIWLSVFLREGKEDPGGYASPHQ